MKLKNRVALYGLACNKDLSYDEVVTKMNWKHWLFIKVIENNETLYVRVPDDSTFRDIEMFAKGYQSANPKITIERKDYNL